MSSRHRGVRGVRLSRRHLLRAGGGSFLVMAAGGGTAWSPAARVAAAQERVTLRFWTPGGTPLFCETHNAITADYEQVNPNVAFEDVQCGTSESEDFIQVLLASIAAGNPPDATILWDTPVSLGARGALLALDDLMQTAQYAKAENWPQGLLQSCQFEGKTYGLPVTAGLYGIWYNEELFEAKGVPTDRASFPKTWDELRRLSKEFTVWEGDRLASAGFVPWSGISDPYTLPIWSALNGGQLYDAADQRYTIDAEPNVAMMDYFIAWLDEEYGGDITKVQRSGSWTGYTNDEGLPPAFQEGRQATMEQGSWLMGDFAAEIEPVFQRWNIAPYPVGPGGTQPVSGYWPNWLVIPEGGAHPEEAFGYLDYLSGVGAAKWFAAVPDIPTNTAVPDVLPEVVVTTRGEEFAAEIMAFFDQQAQVATPMWNSPVESFANDQLQRALEQIMTKAASPKDALAQAQQACQAELEKALQG